VCLQGASAVQTLLATHHAAGVRVFAVWEPIMPIDWSAPNTFVMRRIPDPRVRQYWDPDHLLAHRMAQDARPPQPAQTCCEQNNALWDLAAVYPKGARWTDRMPVATVFDGPVVDVIDRIERALTGSQ
jgi:hypothetical protein